MEQKPEHAGDIVGTARAGTGGAEGTAVDMPRYTDSCSMAMAAPASVGARSMVLRQCFGTSKRAESAHQEIRSRLGSMALLLMTMDRRPSLSAVTRFAVTNLTYTENGVRVSPSFAS